MDTIKRKMRKGCIILAVSVVVLIVIIIGISVSVADHYQKSNSPTSAASSLRTVCSVTRYRDACISSISKIPTSSNTTDPEILFKLSLKVVIDELGSISDLPKKLAEATNDEILKSGLRICGKQIEDAMDSVKDTVSAMEVGGDEGKKKKKNFLNSRKIDDLETWLTAALTYYSTCFDALDEFETDDLTISQKLKSAMRNSVEFTSNSLAIVAKVLCTSSDFEISSQGNRRLLDSSPNWVSPKVRRLLQAKNLKPNVTVAADGTGDVKTVNEAVALVPNKGNTMFVIYVKSGTYVENVVMDKNKWNVMIYGDGMAKTIISGSKSHNANPKLGTFETATFGVEGKGFIMKDIGIINTAGPTMGQAVAFHSQSEFSVYYRCSFDGYQDTLYPHTGRQFYRDCDVTGTVDFIFGNAAVVFQNCTIRPRQPLPGQYNTITAQGREDSFHKSGISIDRCIITPNGNVTAATYLGRPWKEYSTTVIMNSWIGSFVSGEGWIPWDEKKHIFIGEYKNSGPGSGLNQRVTWDGYKPVMSDAEAKMFTVASFIGGNGWLPATGVPYQPT